MAHTSSAKTPVTPRLYLLGAFRLEIGKQPVRLPTRKVESLLAFLALSPQPHTREKLAALLWGDFTDEQARHSLRTALATLRKELRGDTLLADRETVQLNPDCPLWVDAREFEQTVSNNPQSAVELYQGDLLTDFYDDWILQERERLRLLYIDTLLRLAQQARSHSEYARAIEFAQKVLAADPADEKAYQHIIFCHAVMGDRIGALKQYDECEKKLRDELGVEPSRETVALRDRIEQELTGGKSREALFTNVPVPLTSFVGRQLEMAEVKRLLETTRLLTLTGAGGCGKTRLAIQIATDLAHANRFKNGVWWVDLAALSNPALVPQTVANVFDLRESPQAPLIAILINYFRAKELLLVLDNCEHLIEACARLTETLLSACPQLRILMTSREALNIAGETTYRVPSLSLPDPQRLSPLPALTQYEAVRLFIERAVAVQPAFSVTNANAPAVAQICQHLDGIPLAIELAAARIRALSPDQIAARLDDRFNLLTGGSRTALPRHQTLRAAMDWSYDLLSESERVLLQRLSVFAGGWTLEAAEAVCAEENASLLDVLTSLIDKSLVVVEEKDVEMRYRLLEMIRQYTHEKLHESGESQAVRDRHLEYFLSLAEEGEPYVKSGQTVWLDRLETEFDNMRAAWEQAIESDVERALRLASALEWFWGIRGTFKEERIWLTRLLPLTKVWGPSKHRAQALRMAGKIASATGDNESARPLLEAGLAIAKAVGDKPTLAITLHNLGDVFIDIGNLSEARACLEDSLALYREVGDAWGIGLTTRTLGRLARDAGDYESAHTLYEESLLVYRSLGDKLSLMLTLNSIGELVRLQGDYSGASAFYAESLQLTREIRTRFSQGSLLHNLGHVALHERDYVRARALFEESLAVYRQRENTHGLTLCVAGFAGIMGATGKPQQAAQLIGAVEASFEAIDTPMDPVDRMEYDRNVAAVRAQLDEATFNAAWAEGRKMTLEQAIQYALEKL